MIEKKDILNRRFKKLTYHYQALKEYHQLIVEMLTQKDLLTPKKFNLIKPKDRAVFDAYLKRFSSIQDFLGAKIFPLLTDLSGISTSKMTEVLYYIEKEGVIDSLEQWIELREIRNELEHDYPEELQEALDDLKYCIDHFHTIEFYYKNSLNFAKGFLDETI